MTSAERAREIDREEFEAQSRAARERALSYAAQCRARDAAKVASLVIGSKQTSPLPHRTFNQPAKYMAFGVERTMAEWEAFTGIKRGTIQARLRRGKTLEQALAKPVAPYQKQEAQR